MLGRSVWLLSLACFTSMASQRICDAMLPELSRQFNSPLAATAQVVSAFALTYGLTQLFFGSLRFRQAAIFLCAFRVLFLLCMPKCIPKTDVLHLNPSGPERRLP
jgi:predicted MFS family arabinose efflux permease